MGTSRTRFVSHDGPGPRRFSPTPLSPNCLSDVDQPALDSTKVYGEPEIVEAAKKWLEMAKASGARVVLVDAPDRTPAPVGSNQILWNEDRGRRLLKRVASDKVGVLTWPQVEQILKEGNRVGIKILWAGGIDAEQAYGLGRRGVFGIYTTSATARQIAVTDTETDRAMAARPQPTREGVSRIKLLLEAGFLTARLEEDQQTERAQRLHDTAQLFVGVVKGSSRELGSMEEQAGRELVRRVTQGWQAHFDT